MPFFLAVFTFAVAVFAMPEPFAVDDQWQVYEAGTKASLRGLAPVNADVAWALWQQIDAGADRRRR